MIDVLLIAALTVSAVPFDVHALDGASASGSIAALSAQELALETESGPATFPLAKLAAVVQKPAPEISMRGALVWIELADGSVLPAVDYAVGGGTAKIRTSGDATHEVPTRSIRFVRFGAPDQFDPKLTKQWTEITETKAAGDLLVVRKSGALDYLEGVLGDIDADVCHFKLDGEDVPVKRAKIEGIVYARAQDAPSGEPIGKLVATDGSRLQLTSLELKDGQVTASTVAGTSHALPLEQVARFDFSSGKIAYLSDLEPEGVQFTPLVGFKDQQPGLLEYYAYRRDVGFDRSPLRLDGKTYNKGLSLASRTELVYKLPGKFRLFRATVGIDDAVRETGSVRLEIKGDGKTLWQADVRGSEPARELELEIGGVKRLEIVVDYGEGLDVGDRLDLAEAQVTK